MKWNFIHDSTQAISNIIIMGGISLELKSQKVINTI